MSSGSICDKDQLWETSTEEEQELKEELEKYSKEQDLKEKLDLE